MECERISEPAETVCRFNSYFPPAREKAGRLICRLCKCESVETFDARQFASLAPFGANVVEWRDNGPRQREGLHFSPSLFVTSFLKPEACQKTKPFVKRACFHLFPNLSPACKRICSQWPPLGHSLKSSASVLMPISLNANSSGQNLQVPVSMSQA